MGEALSLVMFGALCGVLLLGFPVAFSLAGVAIFFALIGSALDVFDLRLLGGLSSRYFGVMLNEVLVTVPLFIFMGVMLERSKLAEHLLESLGQLFGRLRGGLVQQLQEEVALGLRGEAEHQEAVVAQHGMRVERRVRTGAHEARGRRGDAEAVPDAVRLQHDRIGGARDHGATDEVVHPANSSARARAPPASA